MLLLSLGMKVKLVFSGEEAIKLIENESFDIILTDINLTGINGYQIAIYIHETLKLNIPIVAITAEDHINNEFAIHFKNIIHKPFEKKQLQIVLGEIFI